MVQEKPLLAIVVPAFKGRYLTASLQSILAQTDTRFRLYIGDDASPDPLQEIVAGCNPNPIHVVYHRFAENLGGRSLVAQWARCLALSEEPWIWLFSDDDVMAPDCVASFYKELETNSSPHDLYRFKTELIDGSGRVVQINEAPPKEESGWDFLLARTLGNRMSSLQEIIFAREAYTTAGGFPDFPLAWAADDAFIVQMGLRRRLRTIADGKVQFRNSGLNISSASSPRLTAKKFAATIAFCRWVLVLSERPAPTPPPSPDTLRRALVTWAADRAWLDAPGFIPWRSALQMSFFLGRLNQKSPWGYFSHFFNRNRRYLFRQKPSLPRTPQPL